MNKHLSVGVATALILLAIAATFTVTMIFAMNLFDSKVLNVKERAAMYDKLNELDVAVRQDFCYDIDEVELTDSIARGYINGLQDENSEYLTAEEISERKNSANGMETTLGFEYRRESSGYVGISKVYEDSTAYTVGLAAGDIIVKINDIDVLSVDYEQVCNMLSNGIIGEKTSITYSRDQRENTVDVTWISREYDTVLGYSIDSSVYYIRINDFKETTASQFAEEIAKAKDKSAKGIIFDIRDNDGGISIKTAADMLDMFMPAGTLVVGRYNDGVEKVLYTSDAETNELPIVVLIDENTQGFAELFAAVMSDKSNCSCVGKTTAGSGTLQSLVQLTDGSGVNLTVAILQTANGTEFDNVGVKPDYEVDAGEGFVLDTTAAPTETNDPQFKKALELMNAMLK